MLGLTNPNVRRYIYTVIGAALLVVVAYNLIDPNMVPVWMNFVSSVLALVPPALAIPNTPVKTPVSSTDNAPRA